MYHSATGSCQYKRRNAWAVDAIIAGFGFLLRLSLDLHIILYPWETAHGITESGATFRLLGATYAVQRVLRAAGFARGLEWERPARPRRLSAAQSPRCLAWTSAPTSSPIATDTPTAGGYHGHLIRQATRED